jgi:PAS domain S-box-containing protein
LDLIWCLSTGSEGSVTYYFFPVLLYPLTFFRGKMRWVLTVFVVIDICALLALEHFYLLLTIPFQAPSDRLIDLLSGIFGSCLVMVMFVWVILTYHDWEHNLIACYARALAVSEKNYREVVENARSVILRLDRQGHVTFLNKFGEELLGLQRTEIIGKPVVGTIVPETALTGEDLGSMVTRLLKHPEQHGQIESETIGSDGRRIRISWAQQPVYDDHNQLQEILCVGIDVTERAALLERLLMTQRTMDSAAEQIIWTDPRARIVYANAAVTEALGYTAEELRSLTVHDIATDFPASVWEQHWDAIRRDRSATFEGYQRRKDGSTFPVEITTTYIKIGDKEYATAYIRDITERKHAEEKRLQIEQQMQHMQRLESLGILAGGIAHDFNNILTAILGNISLLRIGVRQDTDEFELLSDVEKASLHAKDLTAQLLTFSKGGKPVRSVVALEPVIRDSAGLALRGSSVKCSYRLDEDLWPVEADVAQLAQVFENLVINAHQAMPGGGEITIRGKNLVIRPDDSLFVKEGRYVQVTVHDEGIGIPDENLPRIFDPYFTTKKTGSGLGLAVTYSIIRNHSGQISVRSKVGAGTTFTILLPASDRNLAAQPTVAAPVPSHSRRILVMDDQEMVRKTLCRMLEKMGHEAECACSGDEVLTKYQQAAGQGRPFDAVIVDLTIPGAMGGKEVVQRLLKIDPEVKAIASSGYSDDPVMADYEARGFRGVMAKPYTTDELRSVLQKVMNN